MARSGDLPDRRRASAPFVASDRISAFDHILDSLIPDKGRILTAMSVFFFDYMDAPTISPVRPTTRASLPRSWAGRWWCGSGDGAGRVRGPRLPRPDRGCWDYQRTGSVCGIPLSRRGWVRPASSTRCSPRRPRPSSSTTRTSVRPGDRVGRRRPRQPAARAHPADLCPGGGPSP